MRNDNSRDFFERRVLALDVRHDLTVRHDDESVADLKCVIEIVRDEDAGHAILPQLGDVRENLLRFANGERAGGLVEQQHLVLEINCARDRDGLLLAPGKSLDRLIGRRDPGDLNRVLENVHRDGPHFTNTQTAEPVRDFPAAEDIAHDGHGADEGNVLVDRLDSELLGVAARAKGNLLALIEELATVRLHLLAGALTGGSCSKPGVDVLVNNQLSVLIDSGRIGDAGAFEAEARQFIEWVKASPPVEGGAVLVPGEPEVRSRREAAEAGLSFDETTWSQCVDAAKNVGMSTVEIEALTAVPAASGA